MSRPTHQGGAALIMVLLVLALLTFTAVNIGDQLRFSISRLSNQLHGDQAWWYALGAEDLTRAVLEMSRNDETTHLQQPWAQQGVVFPIDGGLITGEISDQQACFNLNRLGSDDNDRAQGESISPAARQFERLITLTGGDAQYARALRERLQDWIDGDQIPTGFNGAEDLVYTALEPPYQTPNQMLVSRGEIHLVTAGIDPVNTKLLPLLCALPDRATGININTLGTEGAPILAAALGDEFTIDDALQMLAQRPERGWDAVDTALAALGARAESIKAEDRASLTVTSEWFHADIAVQHYGARVRFSTSFTTASDSVVSYARSYEELF